MNLINIWQKRLQPILKTISDLSLLIVRIWLAQEFLFAGYTKLSAGFTPPEWFTELHFPLPHSILSPTLNWGMVGITELMLGAMILLGIWTRLSALALTYVTYVAIYSVHFDLGWSGWNMIETDNGYGFKVPLMIAVMLFTLVGQGAGRWSIDNMIRTFQRR